MRRKVSVFMLITNSDLVFISNLKFVWYDSHILRYFTDFIVESGYDPKLFLGVTSKNCLFRGYSKSNLTIFDFEIQEKEFVRLKVSNERCLTKEQVSASRSFVSDGGRVHYIKVWN